MFIMSRRELMCGAAASVLIPGSALAAETWPEIKIDPEWVRELNERFAGKSGMFHDDSYRLFLQDYSPEGAWLNWGKYKLFNNDSEIVMHESGLPQVTDGKIVYWNAVTLAHHALIMHGRLVLGVDKSPAEFIKAVDKLLELQAANGAFPYPAREHRHNRLPDGWVSAMAQGNALNAFYRAWHVTQEKKYLEAGRRAYQNIMTPIENGGSRSNLSDLHPSLSAYIFFPEYPNHPVDYTLNGYMFAMLGIYDWSRVDQEAAEAFKESVTTLERTLPYFDIDGFSTYDLAHVVLKEPPYVHAHYEGIHVYLLHAIASVTGSSTLKQYEKRWSEKIDDMNKSLRISRIALDGQSPHPVGKKLTVKLGSSPSKSPVQFQFAVKFEGVWTTIQPFSPANEFQWTPEKPGEYALGFYVRADDSTEEYDNFRYQFFVAQ